MQITPYRGRFAFTLPQPTVTHTRVAGTDHAVDAGAAAFAFHLPQPTVTHTRPSGRPVAWLQNLITINTNPVLLLWSGHGRLRLAGVNYEGGGQALSIGEAETVSGEPDRRMTIQLSGIPAAIRQQFLQDVGPAAVTVEWIYSENSGKDWVKIPVAFRGRLSTPNLSEGVLTIEIETPRGDVDRGRPLRWSHEDQQRRFAGDKGMEHMSALAQGGVDTSWPP